MFVFALPGRGTSKVGGIPVPSVGGVRGVCSYSPRQSFSARERVPPWGRPRSDPGPDARHLRPRLLINLRCPGIQQGHAGKQLGRRRANRTPPTGRPSAKTTDRSAAACPARHAPVTGEGKRKKKTPDVTANRGSSCRPWHSSWGPQPGGGKRKRGRSIRSKSTGCAQRAVLECGAEWPARRGRCDVVVGQPPRTFGAPARRAWPWGVVPLLRGRPTVRAGGPRDRAGAFRSPGPDLRGRAGRVVAGTVPSRRRTTAVVRFKTRERSSFDGFQAAWFGPPRFRDADFGRPGTCHEASPGFALFGLVGRVRAREHWETWGPGRAAPRGTPHWMVRDQTGPWAQLPSSGEIRKNVH